MTLPDVRPLIQQLVERFHPEKVILFGSYAYGEPHEGSDLDLLVVVSHPPQRREAWRITTELGEQYPISLQIIFMDPEEFEETKDVIGGVAYPASHWGKILHEADS